MSLSFVASQIYLLPVTIICIFIEFFTPRITKYKLICGSGLNVMHKTSLYLIAHMWFNQLPVITKSSLTLAQFHSQLNDIKFIGCQCMNCVNLICLYTIINLNLNGTILLTFNSYQFLFWNYLLIIVIYCCIDLDIVLSQVFFTWAAGLVDWATTPYIFSTLNKVTNLLHVLLNSQLISLLAEYYYTGIKEVMGSYQISAFVKAIFL